MDNKQVIVPLYRDDSDDQRIIEAVLAGDTLQFAILVARHTERVHNLALRLLDSSEEAQDMTQEAFLRAYTHLATFRNTASFATWLYRIALNVCRDQLRHRHTREQTVDFSQIDLLWADEHYSVDPEQMVLALEDRQVLEAALKQLPASYRATLLLHEVDGLSLQDVADLMSVPLPTVKSRLQRARMALVTLLDEASQPPHMPLQNNTTPRRSGNFRKEETV